MRRPPPRSTLFPYTTLFRSFDEFQLVKSHAAVGAQILATIPNAENATVEALLIDRKSTRLNSSHLGISYAVFCLKKKKKTQAMKPKQTNQSTDYLLHAHIQK